MYGPRAHKTLNNGAKVIANFIWQTGYREGLLDTITQEWKAYRNAQ
jgi:hypothetical protein